MKQITFQEFYEYPNVEKYIFFFTIPGMCGLCALQEKEYLKFNIPNLVKVVGTILDEEKMMRLGIHALPCTIIFNKDGIEKVKKYGVLYEKQIKELIKEFENEK